MDLSGFNQFISGTSPLLATTLSPGTPVGLASATSGSRSRMKSLPLINEFDPTMLEIAGVNPGTTSTNSASSTSSTIPQIPLRTVSGSTTSSSSSATDLNLIPLEDLDYVKLATDQFGCRFLQKKLDSSTKYEAVRDLMYQGIQPFFLELILDPFGNYLIQKLCDYLTLDQKTTLIQDIYPNVFQISINQYGTRSLQKIIDTVDNESQIDMLIKGFSQQFTSIEQVVTLINDLNGNHVIQKCIFKFPPTKFDFIIDAIVEQDNIIKISTHKHGCCVLQKLAFECLYIATNL